MNYSRPYMTILSEKTGFLKDVLEKSLRLIEILRFLNQNPYFENLLALKGGTAINLTEKRIPRLSLDIDLDFAKNLSKEETFAEREKIKKLLISYLHAQDYQYAKIPRNYYALLPLEFHYRNFANNLDKIQIEINFMDRCHVFPLVKKPLCFLGKEQGFEILTLDPIELYASKINALLSRAAPRDLYDIHSMIINEKVQDLKQLRRCLVFYNMIGGNKAIENVDYHNIQEISLEKCKSELRPVLSANDDFKLEIAKNKVIAFLKSLLVLDAKEKQFISLFQAKEYHPELLFESEDLKHHPMALWRCQKSL
ncbi:MAG: nucleotidyl transferase AbiEii/AbiGii toxin family protein [Bacilli bacterium]|jgi:predicted nucleotidyltransferase component of viral defense system|nr:nucleotidyl transferase AbiEii/AbiGii toxin family protein [Bacilli bacterium]